MRRVPGIRSQKASKFKRWANEILQGRKITRKVIEKRGAREVQGRRLLKGGSEPHHVMIERSRKVKTEMVLQVQQHRCCGQSPPEWALRQWWDTESRFRCFEEQEMKN